MFRAILVAAFLGLAAANAPAQGITAEILSGKLIKPEVGVYAWYDLKDHSLEKRFRLRQAVVGKERIRLKTGYWLETQIIPEVGFPAVYKMLLTGPASDPKNVHRVILQEGQRPPVEIEVQEGPKDAAPEAVRKSLGEERIALAEGTIVAERFEIVGSASEGGEPTEVWINEAVRPMGLVRFRSAQGELTLIRYGVGGADGQSALDADAAQEAPVDAAPNPAEIPGGRIRVEVSTDDKRDSPSSRNRVQERLDERRRRP